MVEKKKRCCECKAELLPSDFHKCKSHKDGLASICKTCDKKKVAKWVAEYPDRRNQIRRKNYLNNKERYNQISAEWNKTHKAEHMVSHNKWKNKNPDNVKAVRTRYENRRRAWERNTDSRVTTEQINKLIKDSENICFWCDEEIPRGKMHLDHIYPLSKGGKDENNNLVVSCEDCNKRKANKLPEVWLDEIIECQKK